MHFFDLNLHENEMNWEPSNLILGISKIFYSKSDEVKFEFWFFFVCGTGCVHLYSNLSSTEVKMSSLLNKLRINEKFVVITFTLHTWVLCNILCNVLCNMTIVNFGIRNIYFWFFEINYICYVPGTFSIYQGQQYEILNMNLYTTYTWPSSLSQVLLQAGYFSFEPPSPLFKTKCMLARDELVFGSWTLYLPRE